MFLSHGQDVVKCSTNDISEPWATAACKRKRFKYILEDYL